MSKKNKHKKQLNTVPQPEEPQKKPLKMPEITMTFDAMFSSALEQMLDETEPEDKKPEKEPASYPVVVLPEKADDRRTDEHMPPPIRQDEQTYVDDKVEQALLNFVSAEEESNEAIRSYQDDLSEEPMAETPKKTLPDFSLPELPLQKGPTVPLPEPMTKEELTVPLPEPMTQEEPTVSLSEPMAKEKPTVSLPEPMAKEEPTVSLPEPTVKKESIVPPSERRLKKDRLFRQPEVDFGLPSFMEQAVSLHETEASDAPDVFTVPHAEEPELTLEAPQVFTVPETRESDAMEAPERFAVPEQQEEINSEPQPEAPEKEKDHSGWFHRRKKTQPEAASELLPAQPEQPEEAPEEPLQSESTEDLLLRIYSLLGETEPTQEPRDAQEPEALASDRAQTIRFSVPEERETQRRATEQTVRIPEVEEKPFRPAPIRQEPPRRQDLMPPKEEKPQPTPRQPEYTKPEAAETQTAPAEPEEAPVDFWQEFAALKELVMSSEPAEELSLTEVPETPEAPSEPEPTAEEPMQQETPAVRPKEKFSFFKYRREKRDAAQEVTEAPETETSSQAEPPAEAPEKPQEPAETPEQPQKPASAPQQQSNEKPHRSFVPGVSALTAAAALFRPQHRAEEPTVIQSADAKTISAEEPTAEPEAAPQQPEPAADELQFLHRRREKPPVNTADETAVHRRKAAASTQDVLRPDEAIRSYNQKFGSVGTRLVLAVFVTVLSLFFTLYATFGWTFLPQEGNLAFTAYILLALLLITAALAYDIFKDALQKLKNMQFTAASLVAFALLVIVADTVQAAATDRVPFCTVASVPVLFLLWDKYDGITGILTTLRAVGNTKDPKGIVEVHDVMKGRVGLSRAEGSVDDFMSKYETQPPTVKLMQFYAPITVGVCIIAAAFIASKSGAPFFWVLALLLLGAIPLIGILNFSRLFCILAKRLRSSDAALCGWYGAETFGDEHAILVGDADLFPESNIKFNGIKMISPNADRVIAYAAAAMHAVGSVLSPIFEEELRSRNGRHYRVDRYRFYESGGIGAQISGDIVLMGTLDFMKRMGVHMEGGMKLKQAVYTSVNGELAAVFAIKYTPKESVSRGLTAIASNRHFRTIFVTRDFLLTPELIREKYEISLSNTAYPPIKERIRLSETELKEKGKQGALMADESFGSFADAAAGGRVLKSAVRVCMLLTVFNGIVGALLMGILAFMSGFEAATALNLLLYELIWAIPTLLLTGWTRRY